MTAPALQAAELELLNRVFRRHPEISDVRLFGSRAKGTHQTNSDIDLVLGGAVDELRAEAIAAELDELPLPYHFDVMPFTQIVSPSLREHIERVGITLYVRAVEREPQVATAG